MNNISIGSKRLQRVKIVVKHYDSLYLQAIYNRLNLRESNQSDIIEDSKANFIYFKNYLSDLKR